MDSYKNIIISDDQICNGKPVIKGTRIAVYSVLEFLSNGDTYEDVLKAFPGLKKEHIMACLQFASDLMKKNYSFKPVA